MLLPADFSIPGLARCVFMRYNFILLCCLGFMRFPIPPFKSITKSLRTSDSPLAERWVWLFGTFLAVGLLLRLIRVSLNHGSYDHDIDTFLYMAWRLLKGNLLFIDHYDSKWPIIQYLYIPSFLSGSIMGHRLITFVVNIITALLFYRCLQCLQRLDFLGKQIKRNWMVLCSVLLLCFSQTHPGGLSGHLHLFANSFLVLALWLLLRSLSLNPGRPWGVAVLQLLAGGSLACAIQTRPNLLISTGCCGLVWLVARCLQGRWGWLEGRAMLSLATGAVLVSLAFVLPYLFYPDGLLLLKTGGWDLLNQWNAEGHGLRHRTGLLGLLKAMYFDQAFVDFPAYGLPLLPIPIVLFLNLRRSQSTHPRSWTATAWVPLLSTSFIVGLWFSYLRTHFWPHYLLMEAVPIALLFAWIPAGLAQSRAPQALRFGCKWSAVVLGTFIVSNLIVVEPIRLVLPAEHPMIVQARDKVLQHLHARSPNQRFLAPGDPSFHWQLQEPMPIKGIHRAWTFDPADSLSPSRATQLMGIATNPSERCNQLLAKPTDLIVWVESKASVSLLQNCLAGSEDSWQELTEAWGITGSSYRVFQRRP